MRELRSWRDGLDFGGLLVGGEFSLPPRSRAGPTFSGSGSDVDLLVREATQGVQLKNVIPDCVCQFGERRATAENSQFVQKALADAQTLCDALVLTSYVAMILPFCDPLSLLLLNEYSLVKAVPLNLLLPRHRSFAHRLLLSMTHP